MKKLITAVLMLVFDTVASAEYYIARVLHLTYNEVNILVYYLLIPLSWTAIIDYKTGYPILSILFILFWSCLYLKVRKNFNCFCNVAFRQSQMFLFKFSRIGWNYVISSVIVCVLVPILVYILLLSL